MFNIKYKDFDRGKSYGLRYTFYMSFYYYEWQKPFELKFIWYTIGDILMYNTQNI